MEPNNPEHNGVWISREEYDRLRQAQAQAATAVPQPSVIAGQPVIAPEVSTQSRKIQIVVGIALAIAIYFVFTTGASPIFSLAVFALAALFVMFTLIEMIRGKSDDPALVGKNANYRTIYKGIGIVMLVALLAPVIYYAGMMALFIIIMSLGGYRGS